jgi:hypothetical protein
MKILLISTAYNGLTQRAHLELAARGHEAFVELAISDAQMTDAVALVQPDIVICRLRPGSGHVRLAALQRPAGLRARHCGLCVRALVMRCVQIPPAPECPFMTSKARPLQPDHRGNLS